MWIVWSTPKSNSSKILSSLPAGMLQVTYIERLFIKGGGKPENPGKNHLTISKQNLTFPHDPREARTTAMRKLMD